MSDYEKLEKPTLYENESNPLQMKTNDLNYIVSDQETNDSYKNYISTLALARINKDLKVRIENKILNEINCKIDKTVRELSLSYLIGISEIYKNIQS